jgi:hypothetical protein
MSRKLTRDILGRWDRREETYRYDLSRFFNEKNEGLRNHRKFNNYPEHVLETFANTILQTHFEPRGSRGQNPPQSKDIE